MTRTEELMTMTGAKLIELADKYGVKVYTNKERKQLKEKKTVVVDRLVKHEEELAKAEAAKAQKKASKKESAKREVKEYEYNGKSQTLAAWAKELGVATSTLYGRIVKRGMSVEEAFTAERTSSKKTVYEFNGKAQTLAEWSKELGISTSTLYGRIKYRGCTIEEAFTMKKEEKEQA